MLISQQAQCEIGRWQGSPRTNLAQLRRQLSDPSQLSDGQRQRLADLSKKLARVQAFGVEFGRVDFSSVAASATAALV